MAIDVSVTFAGNQVKFQKAIAVQGFSWGAENENTVGSASGGAGAGKVKLTEAVISKPVDELASSLLFQLLTTGGHLDSATFEFRKAGGGGPSGPTDKPWITIKLSQVFVTQLAQSVSAGDESPNEVVHLAYGAVNMAINSVNTQGAITPGTPIGWNQVTNQPANAITG